MSMPTDKRLGSFKPLHLQQIPNYTTHNGDTQKSIQLLLYRKQVGTVQNQVAARKPNSSRDETIR
jgi:hypothetical protein